MIIIFTHDNDISANEVYYLLRRMGEEVLLIGNRPTNVRFSHIDARGIYFEEESTSKCDYQKDQGQCNFNLTSQSGRIYNLLDAKSVWWRRTGLYAFNLVERLPEHYTPNGFNLDRLIQGPESLLREEIRDLRRYINTTLYQRCERHLGNPNVMDLNRLATLDLARTVGLQTPNFAIVTNYNQLENLPSISDTFVVKAINNGIYDFYDNMAFYSYTEAMHKSDFAGKDIPIFPSLVMSIVEKQYEIRSFYMAGEFYSMAIFSQNNEKTQVDFRKYDSEKPNKNEPYKLPEKIENQLRKIYSALDLNCGSADLIVDKKGDYIFLEINPVGQFQMTSVPCNYDLEQRIADYLAGK